MPFSKIATELENNIQDWEIKLTELSAERITIPKNSQNRNIKEILGHMVDSVSNNTHRVVHLQYRESPVEFPNYATYGNNDKWIVLQNYQDENWNDLIQLWKFTHLHFSHLIKNINIEKLDSKWIADNNVHVSLKDMVEDFPRHFQLHINVIAQLIKK